MKSSQKKSESEAVNNELIEAIKDLTRVLIITSAQDGSKSEMIRKLTDFSVSPTRIAKLLGMKPKDVTSVISKVKKSKTATIANEKNTLVEDTLQENN